MLLAIDSSRITLIAVSEATPKLDFGTPVQRTTRDGTPLFTVSVVLIGTGDRQDPTVKVTVASSDAPLVKRGDILTARNLTARTWTIRDNGRERSGVSFTADELIVAKTR